MSKEFLGRGNALPLIQWTIIRLVVSENDWRRHDSEMEPQGRRKFLSASCMETNQDYGPEEGYSQIESACSSSWAKCRGKKVRHLAEGEVFLLTSLYIGLYR